MQRSAGERWRHVDTKHTRQSSNSQWSSQKSNGDENQIAESGKREERGRKQRARGWLTKKQRHLHLPTFSISLVATTTTQHKHELERGDLVVIFSLQSNGDK